MSFSPLEIQRIWEKGTIVPGTNPAQFRQDHCGAWMGRDYYGNTNTTWGWEIDHIKPVAHGGTDDVWNLQPLQWENNRAKADGRQVCAVKAIGNKNFFV